MKLKSVHMLWYMGYNHTDPVCACGTVPNNMNRRHKHTQNYFRDDLRKYVHGVQVKFATQIKQEQPHYITLSLTSASCRQAPGERGSPGQRSVLGGGRLSSELL